ncbi:glycoside hydrolase family 99-like domain-containing protein [Vibrio kanaloae]|uniref:glycosyltransferase WbsX family protein n=1 Tax=Vibrio kanaloae TaxID=170673 RepID=UPI0010BD7E03|nr:glycoside hydrolase family 99-like domain-containing protein [Vibrio kanaloae]TKF02458.1 glycosyltransferase WbsX family protein [Vibrio kanaloae]TKF53560.1 glycosyltransferase WbsX family protein [Vibrio kanaloae]
MNKLKIHESFAYYLPQYHEVKENNEWWGEGFTEWVNLKNAKKISNDHEIFYPEESLGYYDLNDINVVESQYKLAKSHGVSSFCFWHYWFDDNDMLLERVAENILSSDIDVRFCFAWANHSWFNKTKGILLKKQVYTFDYDKYFNYLLKFFKDDRYTKIDGKPVFIIYRAQDIPDFIAFRDKFEALAQLHGFPGLFWIGENLTQDLSEKFKMNFSLDSGKFLRYRGFMHDLKDKIIFKLQKIGINLTRVHDYSNVVSGINKDIESVNQMPIVFPNWDSTIRHGKRGVLLKNSSPQKFEQHLQQCYETLSKRDFKDRILMVKSWNEWAEGNFLEPSSRYGDAYLKEFSKKFECRK